MFHCGGACFAENRRAWSDPPRLRGRGLLHRREALPETVRVHESDYAPLDAIRGTDGDGWHWTDAAQAIAVAGRQGMLSAANSALISGSVVS